MTIAPELRSLSVQDYRRMVEAGILAADERVELIEGQLYLMAAKGTANSAAVTRIRPGAVSAIGRSVAAAVSRSGAVE